MYAATRGSYVKWGAQIPNGRPGTTAPPAGDDPGFIVKKVTALKQWNFTAAHVRDHSTAVFVSCKNVG